jgi:type I restriction enzyme S subunit
VIPRSEITDAEPRADDLRFYKRAHMGDIVINRMSAYQGALGLVLRDGVVSPDYLVLEVQPLVEARWLRACHEIT